jgi:hypothetical protein
MPCDVCWCVQSAEGGEGGVGLVSTVAALCCLRGKMYEVRSLGHTATHSLTHSARPTGLIKPARIVK